MVDTKTSALTEATTLGNTDELYANDSGTSVRITIANAKLLFGSINIEDYGAVGDDSTDSTTAIQSAFAALSAGERIVFPPGIYRVAGTIAPNKKFQLYAEGATIRFMNTGTYTDILDRDDADTGVDVAWDTKNCNDSVIAGHLSLSTSADIAMPRSVNEVLNDSVISNLAGMACSSNNAVTNGEGANTTYEHISILKFGWGMYQASQSGSGDNILPFTRCTWNLLEIEFCIKPFETGADGNCFDDTFISSLRISRCYNFAVLKSTSLTAGAIYMSGLGDSDVENETGTITSGTASLTLSAAGDWANGETIALQDSTNGVFVTQIASGGGTTTLTLEDNAPRTYTSIGLVRQPPTILWVSNGNVICGHMFVEYTFERAVRFLASTSCNIGTLRVSSGAAQEGGLKGAVLYCDEESGNFQVQIERKSANHTGITSIFYLGAVADAGNVLAHRRVLLRCGRRYEDIPWAATAIQLGAALNLPSGYSNVSDTDDLLETEMGGEKVYFRPSTTSDIYVKRWSADNGMILQNERATLTGILTDIPGNVWASGVNGDYHCNHVLFRGSTGTNAPPILHLAKSHNLALDTNTAVIDTERLGQIRMWGADGTQFTESVRIEGRSRDTVSSGVVPSELHVDVTDSAGAMTVGFVLDGPNRNFRLDNSAFVSEIATVASGNPDADKANVFDYSGTSQTITDITNGTAGQSVVVIFTGASNTVDFTASNLKGNSGADWSPAVNDHMHCTTVDGTIWHCAVSNN